MKWIRDLLHRPKPATAREWFRVDCGDDGAQLDVASPDGATWRALIKWSSITRVCFKVQDLWISDIHIYTTDCAGGYVIPSAADGADTLWEQLERRGVISSEFAKLALSAEKGQHCWPAWGEKQA